jgi:uncharacterized protein (DUF486 family)
MTFAWYGHLKFKNKPLFLVIVISWMIAFFEYCLQVPANRLGSSYYSAAQLKMIQEVLTFTVFYFFSWFYLMVRPTKYDLMAFGLILMAMLISLFQPRNV